MSSHSFTNREDYWVAAEKAYDRLKILGQRAIDGSARNRVQMKEFFASPLSYTYSLEEILYGMGDPSDMAIWLKAYAEFIQALEELDEDDKEDFEERIIRG